MSWHQPATDVLSENTRHSWGEGEMVGRERGRANRLPRLRNPCADSTPAAEGAEPGQRVRSERQRHSDRTTLWLIKEQGP